MDDKIWFYNDWFQVYGPFNKREIIQLLDEKKIKKDYHLWHVGLDDWVCVKNIDIYNYIYHEDYQTQSTFNRFPEFDPSIFNNKKPYNYDEGRSFVKAAGILLIVVGVLWFISSISPVILGVNYVDSKSYLILGWNTMVSIITIIIGAQVFKIKVWSYSWGIGTALLNLIIDLRYAKENGVNSKLFFIPIYLAIAFLLYSNERIFKELEKEKTTDN